MNNATSKSRTRWITLASWLLVIGNIIFWTAFGFSRQRQPLPFPEAAAPPGWLHFMLLLLFGSLGLLAGLGAYLIVMQTHGFTFNFHRPIWKAARAKIYLANIIVPTIVIVGTGLVLSAFLTPLLERLGWSKNAAWIAPIVGSIIFLQVALIWIDLWAPLERRLIKKRLAAKGILPEQMAKGIFVGLSNPARSSLKRFGAIEEDIGMLWVDEQRLVYFGDTDHFSLTPGEVVEVERKVDPASTTSLSGVAHLILNVRQLDGAERRIRLHTEGVWTMGQKRTAMNALAQRIGQCLTVVSE